MNSVQIPTYQAGMDVRFRAAARHSRLVRLLRVAVPLSIDAKELPTGVTEFMLSATAPTDSQAVAALNPQTRVDPANFLPAGERGSPPASACGHARNGTACRIGDA